LTRSILVERDGSIATVTLNRPDKLNALDLATWRLLAETMRQLSGEDDLRCVVITGAGNAFAAGADISQFATERDTIERAQAYGEAEHAAVMSVADCRHPTVAMIRGACVGGGLEIAAACDLRICGRSSRFGVPINRLGLTMAYGELAFFLALVGRAGALEILLEGSVFGAERARELGLVTRIVDDEEVEAEAMATARRIAEGAPLVNRWHKRFIKRLERGGSLTPEEEAEGFAAFGTEDYQIGYRAFLDKQKPRFEGR
jgi:enoyl-CoA hydratase